ncbi:MAG: cyclic nucleotide-binding domain-containing protein [Elusimicrobia bacterium]|nr:cyclic nucleotide-binding domain-containing protein [Elusimicrobiota bacterium]
MSALRSIKRWFVDPQFARKKEFLRSLEIFKDLRDRELGYLVSALHSRTYREGEIVFVEGDIGRALFVLESGAVELTRPSPGETPVLLYRLKPGDFFGEMALLESLPRTATATATEKTRLHLLYKSKLDSLLQSEPRIGVTIMRHLARLLSARLRRMNADPKSVIGKND